MKKMKMNSLQKIVAVPSLLLSALTAFAPPSSAANTAITQEIQPPKITSFQNEGVYQLAQGSDNFRPYKNRDSFPEITKEGFIPLPTLGEGL
jgi:hypothetical protein